jgi:tetratricopeptide (TPR) repeat protein
MASTMNAPVVTRDPRFNAGRSLVSKGLAAEGAVQIFESLAEETASKYGESHIETSAVFFEYGNSLLRAANRMKMQREEEELAEASKKPIEAAAAAAEKRLGKSKDTQQQTTADDDKKLSADDLSENDRNEENEDSIPNTEDAEAEDIDLALTMMENAYSILEEYQNGSEEKYGKWVKQALPRVLLGIGDTLSTMDRHADAADAYSRALELYQEQLEKFDKESMAVERLTAHRRVCEAAILIAEELLFCPPGEDVVTTETQSLIVHSNERVEYISGYYDRARDALQETIFFMAKLAAAGADVQAEKEEICHLSTMIMGVGMQLAEIEEKAAAQEEGGEPAKKKAKKS